MGSFGDWDNFYIRAFFTVKPDKKRSNSDINIVFLVQTFCFFMKKLCKLHSFFITVPGCFWFLTVFLKPRMVSTFFFRKSWNPHFSHFRPHFCYETAKFSQKSQDFPTKKIVKPWMVSTKSMKWFQGFQKNDLFSKIH